MGHRPMYCSNADLDDCTRHESKVRTPPGDISGGGQVTQITLTSCSLCQVRKGLRGKLYGLEDLFHKYGEWPLGTFGGHHVPLPHPNLPPTFSAPGVDLELWAHEHSYERLWPIYNYQVRLGEAEEPWWRWQCDLTCHLLFLLQVFNGSRETPYTNPRGPVHIITGSAVSGSGRGCQPGGAAYTVADLTLSPRPGTPTCTPTEQMGKLRLWQETQSLRLNNRQETGVPPPREPFILPFFNLLIF
jgi:hypothetical protein